jgi:hypothetical protein
MKKFIIYSIALLSAALISSCEYYAGDLDRSDNNQIQAYAADVFGSHVILPVSMAEFAVDFDAYLSLTEEEKMKDLRFYGKIRNPEENHYIIEDVDGSHCSLKTGGKSIWDEDCTWTILSFSSRTAVIDRGELYCSLGEKVFLKTSSVAPGDGAVRLFSLDFSERSVGIVLEKYEDGNCEWNIGTKGVIEDEDGYWAEYTTGSEGIVVINRYNQNMSRKEYICSGTFLVSIYKNEEPLDWCRAVFKAGLITEYITGR